MSEVKRYHSAYPGSMFEHPAGEYPDEYVLASDFDAQVARLSALEAQIDEMDKAEDALIAQRDAQEKLLAEALERIRQLEEEDRQWDKSSLVQICAEREALASQLQAMRAALEWQPIETAPKDHTSVLLLYRERNLMTVAWYDAESGQFPWQVELDGHSHAANLFTHWMPLPSPPISTEGSGK